MPDYVEYRVDTSSSDGKIQTTNANNGSTVTVGNESGFTSTSSQTTPAQTTVSTQTKPEVVSTKERKIHIGMTFRGRLILESVHPVDEAASNTLPC